MSATNQAFIKAYRHDAPSSATPATQQSRRVPLALPVHSAEPAEPAATWNEPTAPAVTAAWHPSIEIVTADYSSLAVAPPTPPRHESANQASPAAPVHPGPVIGKRPLSSFTAATAAPPPTDDFTFTPATSITSFRWPSVCRTLWEQFGDQYERVADQLLASCRGERSLVGIVGLHPGDGCTTTLLNLAAALATRDQHVILVDANFQSPCLANLLGVEPTTGWHDVLEYGIPVADAVIHAARDQVDLLPLDAYGSLGPNRDSTRLAAGLQTSVTAGVLRDAYDLVLVDLGALLAPKSFVTIDHLLRNMRIDRAIAVTDPRQAEPDDLILTAELLHESDCELLGIIENRTAKPQSSGHAQ